MRSIAPAFMSIAFLLFFGLFFTLYFGVHGYVFIRAWHVLDAAPYLKGVFAVLFWLSACSYIIARITERYVQNTFTDLLVWYGSFWLAVITYLFLITLALDALQAIAYWLNIPFDTWFAARPLAKVWVGVGVLAFTALVVALGLRTALMPVVRTLEYPIPKDGGAKSSWNIVFVSDIHLGTIVNRERAQQLVGSIRELNPDIVFLGGDTVDEDIGPVVRGDIGNVLRQINVPYGTYAILGNHEYIGGVNEALAYLTDHDITVLRDETKLIADSFYLVGRDDVSGKRFNGPDRATLAQLLTGVDTTKPVIVLDHQPHKLAEVAADGRIDLQLSGHTHHGQLWPFNYITDMLFEQDWGELRIGTTRFYVSDGWGTWGPPVRIGNHPEVVQLILHFTGQASAR